MSEWFESLFFSEDIGQLKAFLESHQLDDIYVAVRSSGLDEDSKDHSLRANFQVFIKGMDQIIESIKKCWASATPNAH